ncbi:MAG: sugar phosphate isomerase/epimerase family protein [Bryobacteraceae bacterium]|nr:sugar phosphate isomerase/epimerase family protein [Bryobacteraceae bacterium]
MNHPEANPLEEIAWIGELGLDFVDLTLEPPKAASWIVKPALIRAALERHGLRVVGHTAWYLPMASAFEDIRKGALAELKRCIDVFAQVGAKWMNIHPDRFTPWHERRFYVQRNILTFRELIDYGSEHGVGIMIENLPGDFNNVQQLSELLDPLPELGLHLDIGHANLQVPRNTTREIVAVYGSRIRHVHLHDNKGGSADLHLPLGTGSLNLRESICDLRSTGYDGTITLEVFSPDRHFLLYSAERLRAEWKQAETLVAAERLAP